MDEKVLKPCGTVAAYARHRRRGEEPCEECREAKRAYDRADYAANRATPWALRPCGTTAAYDRHLYHGEAPCAPCRAAKTAAYRRARRARG